MAIDPRLSLAAMGPLEAQAQAQQNMEGLYRLSDLPRQQDMARRADALKLSAAMQEQQQAADTSNLEKQKMFANLLKGVTPENYAERRRVAIGLGANAANIPAQYDRDFVDTMMRLSENAEEQYGVQSKGFEGDIARAQYVLADPNSTDADRGRAQAVIDTAERMVGAYNPATQAYEFRQKQVLGQGQRPQVAGAMPASQQAVSSIYDELLPPPEMDEYAPQSGVQRQAGMSPRTQQAVQEKMAVQRVDDVKQAKQSLKAARNAFQSAENVTNTIDKAIEESGFWNTGLMSASSLIPGTPASNLSARLSTIEANLAFDKLQAMRDASPTGGALGQVSERELALLQATWQSVAQSQTEEQLDENLRELKRLYEQSLQNISDAIMQDVENGLLPREEADKFFQSIGKGGKDSGGEEQDPRIKEALDAGYTMEEINQFLKR